MLKYMTFSLFRIRNLQQFFLLFFFFFFSLIVSKDLVMAVINLYQQEPSEGICHVRLDRCIDEHAALCMKNLSLHSL